MSNIDGSLVTTSSIKVMVAPRDEIRTTLFRSARCSEILLGVGFFVIISIVLLTTAIVVSTKAQGNIIFIDFK